MILTPFSPAVGGVTVCCHTSVRPVSGGAVSRTTQEMPDFETRLRQRGWQLSLVDDVQPRDRTSEHDIETVQAARFGFHDLDRFHDDDVVVFETLRDRRG